MENPTCASFEEYEDALETLPIDFTEDGIMWVTSYIYRYTGVLGGEAVELRNWYIHFGCTLEELRVIFVELAEWMNKSSPSWDTYCALMTYCLVDLNKRPGVLPVETRMMLY